MTVICDRWKEWVVSISQGYFSEFFSENVLDFRAEARRVLGGCDDSKKGVSALVGCIDRLGPRVGMILEERPTPQRAGLPRTTEDSRCLEEDLREVGLSLLLWAPSPSTATGHR